MEFYYRKLSMTPTFRPGDLLTVAPYHDRPIRAGDVVVFASTVNDDHVTHRVISVSEDGIKTCGDNIMSQIDPWTLEPGDIVGYVRSLRREGRNRQVLGGLIGLIYHRVFRGFWRRRRELRRIVVAKSRIMRLGPMLERIDVSRVLPKRYRPRVIFIRRSAGHEMLLLMGRRIIGRRQPNGHVWSLTFWFLPFVNTGFLKSAVQRERDL